MCSSFFRCDLNHTAIVSIFTILGVRNLYNESTNRKVGKIMVSNDSIISQLSAINFNQHGWGRTELRELPSIILPEEVIYECVNGIYEGGFALLVATDVRVLLVDKKPLNFLTVEDLRFDMINELDYNHRIIGASISISAGSKNLSFSSLNQPRLRKLITHVQHCMADSKKQQQSSQVDQKQHLERINQQLQTYLLAQHKQQAELSEQLKIQNAARPTAPEIQPTPKELNDFLFAQGLTTKPAQPEPVTTSSLDDEMYSAGVQEIFGTKSSTIQADDIMGDNLRYVPDESRTEINPLKIAYAKLPQSIKNKSLPKAPHIEVPIPNGNQQAPATD